ncbi:hypothetical protein L7Q78_05950 [Achromobacter xylosoxidans]|uniref:hypothetical protein n=1 Tax=Alcaligenes xylosoxydans xylosoxydans TaxID=85698 RepID=UPI001F058969|nr:hypothetical protein [Achromobacter xylosoxidans]MCH1986502.1 hypothetical protein [Achromobacter xylosoxidans]MCH1992304.1 hypothetical protein [Achromobacter xylosoxidans]MCH4586623.1 hypothetical protein [Achromobacter xylosoxidans]
MITVLAWLASLIVVVVFFVGLMQPDPDQQMLFFIGAGLAAAGSVVGLMILSFAGAVP